MSGFQPINTYYLFNFFQPKLAIKSIPRDFFVSLFLKNCQPLRAQKGCKKEKLSALKGHFVCGAWKERVYVFAIQKPFPAPAFRETRSLLPVVALRKNRT